MNNEALNLISSTTLIGEVKGNEIFLRAETYRSGLPVYYCIVASQHFYEATRIDDRLNLHQAIVNVVSKLYAPDIQAAQFRVDEDVVKKQQAFVEQNIGVQTRA